MCLVSGSGPSTSAFIDDKQSLLNPCNLITPTIIDLQECSKEDEVNATNATDKNGAITYPGSASFLPAPWLLADMVLSSGASNFTKLILAVNAAAFEFDTKHADDKSYITSAADHTADLVIWAWGAGNHVTMVRMTFDPNEDDLEHFKNQCHQQYISQI